MNSTQSAVGKIVSFGVGLIGGSFALALKKVGAVREVVGFGRRVETLEQVVPLGIPDHIGRDKASEDMIRTAHWSRCCAFLFTNASQTF